MQSILALALVLVQAFGATATTRLSQVPKLCNYMRFLFLAAFFFWFTWYKRVIVNKSVSRITE